MARPRPRKYGALFERDPQSVDLVWSDPALLIEWYRFLASDEELGAAFLDELDDDDDDDDFDHLSGLLPGRRRPGAPSRPRA